MKKRTTKKDIVKFSSRALAELSGAAARIAILKNVDKSNQVLASEILGTAFVIVLPSVEERLMWFLRKLNAIPEERFDDSFTLSEEYAYLFTRHFGKMLLEYRREKRLAFANLFIRFALKDFSGIEDKETYFLSLDQMAHVDLAVLETIPTVIEKEGNLFHREKLVEKLKSAGMREDIISNSLSRLSGLGMVNVTYSAVVGGTNVNHYLTGLGRNFLLFITDT